MLNMFEIVVVVLCLAVVLAIPITGIALLCRIRLSTAAKVASDGTDMPDMSNQLSVVKISSRCVAIAIIYILTAYQGFGGYFIIVLFPLSMVWLKLSWPRTIVFSLFAWAFLMCANLLLAFFTIFGGQLLSQ
jgi:hypothetical protein|tara:strand:+ start:92 stop:487 length:396 start_codon:yes stop_codon:yes gene_type:complete